MLLGALWLVKDSKHRIAVDLCWVIRILGLENVEVASMKSLKATYHAIFR